MTPEQRLDRAERILLITIQAGRRARTEWNEKVNILIDAQMRHEARLLAETDTWRAEAEASRARSKDIDGQLAQLAESQKLTDAALRDYLNSQRKGQNGESR